MKLELVLGGVHDEGLSNVRARRHVQGVATRADLPVSYVPRDGVSAGGQKPRD